MAHKLTLQELDEFSKEFNSDPQNKLSPVRQNVVAFLKLPTMTELKVN